MDEIVEKLRVELSDHDEIVAGVHGSGEKGEVFENEEDNLDIVRLNRDSRHERRSWDTSARSS